MTRVPNLNLTRLHDSIRDELNQAWHETVDNSGFVMGPAVTAFEDQIKDYFDMPHAVGVASGTDALILALQAMGIGCGHTVITVPFTFVASASSIMRVGATPVFVDVERDTFNMSLESLQSALDNWPDDQPKPAAVMPVHLFGMAANLDPVIEIARQHGLQVIEDSAQAIGALYQGQKVCTFGDTACLSFFPSKNLGSLGEGGMVITRSAQIAEKVEWLRQHGGKNKYVVDLLGYNSRLQALQARCLSVKIKYLDQWNQNRVQTARRYFEGLGGLEGVICPTVPDYTTSIFNQFTIRCRRRDELMNHLSEQQIGTAVYYPKALHQQNLFKGHSVCPVPLSNAEALCDEVLSLPIDPLQTDEETQYVIGAIKTFYQGS